jgi:methionyl aminopeptidase
MSQYTINTFENLEKIRKTAKITASIFAILDPFVQEGVTTLDLNTIVEKHLMEIGAIAAPLEKGFPKAICTSINEVVCHGIPDTTRLRRGDIINIDISIRKDGVYGDTSKMYCIGPVAPFAKRLVELTQEAMYLAIRAVKPGLPVNIIGQTIQTFAHQNKLSIVEEFCGHGIGLSLHEKPQILHYASKERYGILEPGMVFTIEPMINLGRKEIKMLKDGWTAVTKDRSLSAQWEHMILVTATGAEVLSIRPEESFS